MKMQFDMEVSGRVQHVGFRHYAWARARELELTGYVRNQSDGSLRVVAEGELSALETLVDYLKTGPSMARVSSVTVSRSPYTASYRGFTVRY